MTLIKLIALLCAVVMAVQARELSKDEEEMFMMFTEDCRNTHKATDEDMKNIMKGNVPSTPSAKCTMTCTMKQFKVADEEGGKLQLNVDNIVKMSEANGAPKDKVDIIRDVATECKSPEITDECEFSAAVGSCMEAEAKKRGVSADDF